MGDLGGEAAEGAVNACRLATLGKDGESGTFTNVEGDFYECGGGLAVVGWVDADGSVVGGA